VNFRLDKDTVRSNALPNQRDRTARAEGAVGIGVRSSSLQDESKFINAHRPRPLYRPRCFLWMSRGVFALRPSLESHWSLQSSLFIAECSPFVGHSEERLGLSTFGVGSYWIWRQFGAAKLFSLESRDVFALRPSLETHVVCSYRSLFVGLVVRGTIRRIVWYHRPILRWICLLLLIDTSQKLISESTSVKPLLGLRSASGTKDFTR
jgi:hypothetical protein